ncbi:MAG TPA: VanZ family protein [Anaeromyxobacter sp.]
MTERARRTLFGALAALWASLIFWESSQPNPFPFLPPEILGHDKLLHMGAYAVLAGLAVGALARTRLPALGRAAAVAAVLATAYGAADEWHQSYVPGREADPWDWVADAAGAMAGAAAMTLILRHGNPRASIRG